MILSSSFSNGMETTEFALGPQREETEWRKFACCLEDVLCFDLLKGLLFKVPSLRSFLFSIPNNFISDCFSKNSWLN